MTENSNRRSFTRKPSSGVIVKSDSPLSSKKMNSIDRREGHARISSTGTHNKPIRSRIEKMGPICKSRKEAAAAPFLQCSVEEDIDLDKQLAKEICYDGRECMWLSSDCTTPWSVFEENRLFSPCSTLENPIPDAEKTSKNDLNGGEVVTWLLSSSTLSDADESCSENVEWQSCEEPKSCDNSSTPPSSMPDESSQIFYPNRTGFPASLVNLDGEDSDLISDKTLELVYLQPDFPSPSYKSSLLSTEDFNSTLTEHVSEASLEDFNSDEPIFWPFEREFDWRSQEPWIWFSTSPRKDIISPSKSVGVKLHAKKVEPRGCRRRLEFSSKRSASKTLELEQQDSSNDVRRIKTVPSRLSKTTKNTMKIVPLEMEDSILKPKKDCFESNDKLPIEKEDFVLDEELPIEKLLGLDEFDGHEGVDSGFDGDVFSLDESLC
ncbi:hypothetical protein F2P56_015341 [Juglans regia]|uniref:Uncharacterized protein n=2 Tax=Juglans regia TaxID=51240 RepID=A0A834CVB1_JUGRE|nr:uncharacterized protein LOC108979679 [Juglans regia]KAF5465321.1 hypothetical protein F2P56_015341 [Juglans regia]